MTNTYIKDNVKIKLIDRKGIPIAEIPNESHTWQTAGLKAIRDATGTGGYIQINDMNIICSEGTYSAETLTMWRTLSVRAKFEGSWSTTNDMTNIGTIQIQRGSTIYSRITPTPFNKDNDTSLLILWTSTVSGDWNSAIDEGRGWIAGCLVTANTFPSVNTISALDTGATTYNVATSYEAVGDTIGVWSGTLTTIEGKTIDQLHLYGGGYEHSEYDLVPNLTIPSDIDLGINWRSTFSAG